MPDKTTHTQRYVQDMLAAELHENGEEDLPEEDICLGALDRHLYRAVADTAETVMEFFSYLVDEADKRDCFIMIRQDLAIVLCPREE